MSARSLIGSSVCTLIAGLIFSQAAWAQEPAPAPPKEEAYRSRTHTVYTSLGKEVAAEIDLRLSAAERAFLEATACPRAVLPQRYAVRTRRLSEKGPRAEFYFDTRKKEEKGLIVFDYPGPNPLYPWYMIQEGVVYIYMRETFPHGRPYWIAYGLSWYFAHAAWTGGELSMGAVDPRSLREVQELIRSKKLLPVRDLLQLPADELLKPEGHVERRQQLWSIIHYLMHGDGGKYRGAFQAYMNEKRAGRGNLGALFGKDFKAFEAAYEKWWLAQEEQDARNEQDRRIVETLTHFLARAHLQKKAFSDAEAFFKAARNGELRMDVDKDKALWLPESLLTQALPKEAETRDWSLDAKSGRPPVLVWNRPEGVEIRGEFTPRGTQPPLVKVSLKKKPPSISPASATRPATQPTQPLARTE